MDSNPGDATRPAGLRFIVPALAASTNADMQEAMYEEAKPSSKRKSF
jgi:hypothetical protein